MTTLPILSSAQLERYLYQDDPTGQGGCLEEACVAIDNAIAASNGPDRDTYLQPEPLGENLFHIHTSTLQVHVKPGAEDLTRFADMVRKVQSATDAGTPFMLLPPTPNVIHDPDHIPDVVGKLGTAPYTSHVVNQRHRRSNSLIMPDRNRAILHDLDNDETGIEFRFFKGRNTYDLKHWRNAVLALSPSLPPTRQNVNRRDERLHLRTGLEVLWMPAERANSPAGEEARQRSESNESPDVEIEFVVKSYVYLDISRIEVPLPSVLDDMYRYALAQLLHPSAQLQTGNSSDNLHAFYESLSPASSLPEDFDQSLLQPRELLAKLLPFQKRTVNLLLRNEHAPMAIGGYHSRSFSQQWNELYFEGHGMFAVNRLTGELCRLTSDSKGKKRARVQEDVNGLPQVMSPADVRGTMLCEEMGLGKTVEAIALMLLHPHPLSVPRPDMGSEASQGRQVSLKDCEVDFDAPPRGLDTPEMSVWFDQQRKAFEGTTSWSEESQLNVSEVGATLVVTPTTLLSQWVSELAAHSPLLRVCVYPGWLVLVNQICVRQEARKREQKLRQTERNKRKRSKVRNEIRSKYAKALDRRLPVQQEDEGSSDEDDDNDDELLSLLQETQQAWLCYARSHDVVLTTYDTLGRDLQVAHPLPQRSRRSTATYVDLAKDRPRSPLLMVEWWRVIMDEVQLQGRTSNAANMVALIPRKNSLAMSGTPARADVADLMGSLRFLRVPDLHDELWHRLSGPCHQQQLHALFQSLAVRTTKVAVAHEFNIPKQERYIVPIELTNIEVHYYQDTLERARERLRIYHRTTVPSVVLRSVLRNLRQICTHIQVGALQQRAPQAAERAERLQLGRQLLTMGEALTKMRYDHEMVYFDLVKRQMRAMVSLAQYHVVSKTDETREYKALNLYERAQESSDGILGPARVKLAALMGDKEDVDMLDLSDKSISQAERDRIKEITAYANLIRDTLMIVHQAWYFAGDAHHVLKQEEQEVEAYTKAELVRKEILSRSLKKANTAVEDMRVALKRDTALSKLDDLLSDIANLKGGLHTERYVEQANPLFEILNDNATLIFSWRKKIIELLQQSIEGNDTAPAVGEGQDIEDPEAEYYALALKAQGELDVYFTAYAAALADRKEMLSEERTFLEAAEGRVTKKRQTATAGRALATAVDIAKLDATEELEDQLMREREVFRERRVEEGCTRPLKAVYVDINNTIHIFGIRPEEAAIARRLATTLRSFVTRQVSFLENLNKELDMLRVTFNHRVMYYKALQEISDSVRPPSYKPSTLQREIGMQQSLVDNLGLLIADNQSKGRYLQCLGNSDHDMHEDCAICFGTSDDTHAVLLDCGHSFCVSCFREYRNALYIGNRCATCKAPIQNRPYKAYRIREEENEDGPTNAEGTSSKSDTSANSPSGRTDTKASTPSGSKNDTDASDDKDSTDVVIDQEEISEDSERQQDWNRLKLLSDERLRAVNRIEVMGEFGAKIMFLLKHLLWYRINFPEVRHVVFSNWADSLRIVERALEANGIRFVAFDSSTRTKDALRTFQNDASISVFLLHAERESAGLTLTSCAVVHLLEPVLQHSFELQAIGRVDRLGQRKNTEVFCYATLNTVETRILCQAARKGTSIYLADREEADLAIDTMPNIVSAASKGGDLHDSGNDDNNNDDLMSLIM